MKSWRLRNLQRAIDNADSYTEWREAAIEYDNISGLAEWKLRQSTSLYDHHLIRSRLSRLQDLRRRKEDITLLYTLNEGIHGNLGGMGKLALYQKAKFGTKQLITDYIDEIVVSLLHLSESPSSIISFADKVDFFRRASHCFGRSALMLSGGATQGIFHVGVAKALFEQNLLPNIISGSSAGSFLAAVLGTHTDKELEEQLSQETLRLETMKFLGWSKLFKGVPFMDGEHLESAMSEFVPDLTFEEAFTKTGRSINLSISPAQYQHESRLLNAISSPNVYIRKGVMASCAVPAIFPPVTLAAKDFDGKPQPYNSTRKWIDGSITNDLPAKRLSRIYGVNHYIASQINPHVMPFISEKGARKSYRNLLADFTMKSSKHILGNFLHQGREKIKHPALGVFLTQLHAMVAQDYSADIMIYPTDRRFINPMKLFVDPNSEEMTRLIREGEKATWPKIEMIRNCTKISRTLDEILKAFDKEEFKRLSA
jgi:NTE family protein